MTKILKGIYRVALQLKLLKEVRFLDDGTETYFSVGVVSTIGAYTYYVLRGGGRGQGPNEDNIYALKRVGGKHNNNKVLMHISVQLILKVRMTWLDLAQLDLHILELSQLGMS